MVDILSGLFRNDVCYTPDGKAYVEVPAENPMDDSDTSFYWYKAMEGETILVQQWEDGELIRSVEKTIRDILWKNCRLGRVCNTYKKQYEKWKQENSGIPYIETNINDESDGKSERSYEFMRNFWREKSSSDFSNQNLRILLAEYGMGKSSYCHGIRNLVANEIKSPFLESDAMFPFVFDLNEFRIGDIDKFIETELFNKYGISMTYRVFERLCQNGIFMVVLDAWDQMRDARQIFPIKRNLEQLSPMWDKKGKVLITCRRSFYQQQLKGMEKGKEKSKLSQNVGLYKLTGFDKNSVKEYFRQDSLEREKNSLKALMQDADAWVEESWEQNSDLFSKPFNLRLLVRHFDAINEQIDFFHEKADTYRFLEIVLEDWKKKYYVQDELFLKELVSQTLYSGLNRSIPLQQFWDACDEEKRDGIFKSLQFFDLVSIHEKEKRIEFCLAAFQEFLWAHFALEELKKAPEKLDNTDALIRKYLLIREVREWICKVLGQEESECLMAQLQYVKYKSKEDVGYCGSNALTLLCDLNRIAYYKEQLNQIKLNLRRSPLMGTDFRGLDLSEADFYGSDLEGADFSYTKLDNVDFTGADLTKTKWREHEKMTKCAFLIQRDVLCVVAGTKSGGVLTYRINDGEQEIVSLQNDVINDLAGDRGGIYTASSDGWVGYMDKSGNLRNAYIAQSGLQSITYTENESCVYVGADNQGIFRYNWHTGSKQQIEINQLLGDGVGRISDIHYYSNSRKEGYIVYTLSNRRLLVLLKIAGKNQGQVRAVCRINTEGYQFSDICLADDMLIYGVAGKGIFGMPVDEAFGEILEQELLLEQQSLLSLPQAEFIFLSWANESKILMAVAVSEGIKIKNVYTIDLSSDSRKCEKIELDWLCDGYNYCITSEQMSGFGISSDGKYAAFTGDSLAVFQNMGTYYSLIGKPVEAKISCKDADFTSCKGINNTLKNFVKERGAIGIQEKETR